MKMKIYVLTGSRIEMKIKTKPAKRIITKSKTQKTLETLVMMNGRATSVSVLPTG